MIRFVGSALRILLILAISTSLLIGAASLKNISLGDFRFSPNKVHLGPNYFDDGILFVLYAPRAKRVSLVGDFNDWDAVEGLMEKSGGWWYKKVYFPQMNKNPVSYRYYFVVDGKVIGDPAARQVDWNEKGPCGVVWWPQKVFKWEDADFQTDHAKWVIYEIHVADFTKEGTFKALIKKIPYLKKLGITAVELMPIFEFPMDYSWGYNPAYYFAPEKAYGTPDDLKSFINEAHKNGIAVVLDMVFNHTGPESPLAKLEDWWAPCDKRIWFGCSPNPWGFPDFDCSKPATRRFIAEVLEYWVKEYHIDGIRFDYIRGVGWDGMCWIMAQARRISRKYGRNLFLIGEYLPEDAGAVWNSEMDAEWHDVFHDRIKALLREGVFEGNAPDVGAMASAIYGDHYPNGYCVVNYAENHDEERILYECYTNGLSHYLALKKSFLAAVVVLTARGVPMLWMGQEFGVDKPKTIDQNKLNWSLLKKNRNLFDHYKKLVHLRVNNPALRDLYNLEFWKVDKDAKVLMWRRWHGVSEVLVAVNFGRRGYYLKFDLPQGKWKDYIYNVEHKGGGEFTYYLPPYGYMVLVKE